ncbi:MAG: hydantoinase/oxoprolinase family protein [Burkholderiales bacterium]|nr:hydantoinase/oxoprolinase family protein [Burkholderiales bacterium]
MAYRIGIDIGGTFTDFALFDDERHEMVVHKTLTTPKAPEHAVLDGVLALTRQAGIVPADVSMIVHGTTLVTNAVIERRGTPTAMIVTRGFRDVLDIAMEQRYDLFDLRIRFPSPLVPRPLRFEVDERIKADGSTLQPLDADALVAIESQLASAVADHAVRAVAVCLLHSYVNPAHELAVVDWLHQRFPDLQVSASSVVFPFAREYQRWTTACLNAYVQPLVDAYVERLERGLDAAGFRGRFLIMSSSGSTLTPEMARRYPVRLLESGPAAGALMAARHSASLRTPQVLSFDMGGTTAKGCVVRDHVPLKRYEFEVARVHEFKRGSGLPIKIPVIDMIEIGSGGGSLADVDPRGVIRVGPRSAGADPGPACYGRGGQAPTLTDANLVLGYLGPTSFLGGRMHLDVEASRRALADHLGARLGVGIERAAWGVHETINEDVAKAFRVHASERGVDYRRCNMIVFGGSGPIHGARIARKLRIPRVICPSGAGVMSAFGLLASPLGFEVVQSLRVSLASMTPERFKEIIGGLEARVREQLLSAGGQTGESHVLVRLDMRYVGQGYEIEVALPEGSPCDVLPTLAQRFADAYAAIFGMSFASREIEILAWKVEVQGAAPAADATYRLRTATTNGDALRGYRAAYFPDLPDKQDCPVYDRHQLRSGMTIDGPALVEEAESTCVIGPGDRAHVDAARHLVIDIAVTPADAAPVPALQEA